MKNETTKYAFFNSCIVTTNENMSVPLNSKCVAIIDKATDNIEAGKMIHRANTQPELLRALNSLIEDAKIRYGEIPQHPAFDEALQSIDKAKPRPLGILESAVGTLIELVFDSDKTLATFAFPHGTRFRAGAYRIMLDVACLTNQESEK